MVIGLQAELQNILYTLSYSNLDKAIDNAKKLINKYLTVCGNGNASILPTITKFLSELEPLFIQAINVEYKYYVQKEKEESKYLREIEISKEMLSQEVDEDKIKALEMRLKELEDQVNTLEEKKEEIVKRANGKAGYVYVISNLGSFGDGMFKVGMTRRLNPMDRVDELGDASVPFKFDVHAMGFSDNAVGLEQQLHSILEEKRVNKVNLRKEFFYTDVTSLEEIIQDIDPTVEFIKTMTAAEYRQSQSVAV